MIKKITYLFLLLALILPGFAFAATPSESADVVLAWNNSALHAIKFAGTPPPMAARNLAIIHLAIYDAVNSVNRSHVPYHVNLPTPPNASAEAAANFAAYHALTELYPNQADTFAAELNNFSQNQTGAQIGKDVAAAILRLRAHDNAYQTATHAASEEPGLWRPTPPNFAPALYPRWSSVAAFSRLSLSQFMPPAPPALSSFKYAQEVNEVKRLGSQDSFFRTADQTEIAYFWADGANTYTPPGHWNVIAQDIARQKNTSLTEATRLFALLNVSMADAGVLCWDAKFTYNLWRPIDAIRLADQDNNPFTTPDPSWTPLLPTPPFPEYTSGHSTFSAAASVVLAHFFGDNTSFTAYSIIDPSVERSFNSFSQAAEEASHSRIYGGIHFASAAEKGISSGRALATRIIQTQLKPTFFPRPSVAPTPTPTATPAPAPSPTPQKPPRFTSTFWGAYSQPKITSWSWSNQFSFPF